MEVLEAKANLFGGIEPTPDSLPENEEEFRGRLEVSLARWKAEGFKLVWLNVPISQAGMIPLAVDAGFSFHHAAAEYLMLTCRLVEDAFIPPYASHYIGAGGVVVNSDNELLVVRERRGGQSSARSFKLPGGAMHAGELLAEGVVREVLEETGVRTRFESLVCFRNQLQYRYGKSDIYFVCRLTPLSHRISIQVEEIAECRWMPLDRYLNGDVASPFNKGIVRAAMEGPGLAPVRIEGYRDNENREFFMPDGLG